MSWSAFWTCSALSTELVNFYLEDGIVVIGCFWTLEFVLQRNIQKSFVIVLCCAYNVGHELCKIIWHHSQVAKHTYADAKSFLFFRFRRVTFNNIV
jgi:hypothetical protein